MLDLENTIRVRHVGTTINITRGSVSRSDNISQIYIYVAIMGLMVSQERERERRPHQFDEWDHTSRFYTDLIYIKMS